VVPRTSHFLASQQTIGKRAMIMRAVSTNGKEFLSASRQQYFFSIYCSQQFAIARDAGQRNSILQVRLIRIIHSLHLASSRTSLSNSNRTTTFRATVTRSAKARRAPNAKGRSTLSLL
jgi:hypothetical protein